MYTFFMMLGPLICFLGLLLHRREVRQLEVERKRLRDLLREDQP